MLLAASGRGCVGLHPQAVQRADPHACMQASLSRWTAYLQNTSEGLPPLHSLTTPGR